jgi:hypothetical protein
LYICHSFFGMARSHNDVNLLQRSLVFTRLLEVQTQSAAMRSMATRLQKDTILPYVIYPQWSIFVKTILRGVWEVSGGRIWCAPISLDY